MLVVRCQTLIGGFNDAVVVPDCQDGCLDEEKDSKGNKFTERDFLHRIPAFSTYKIYESYVTQF